MHLICLLSTAYVHVLAYFNLLLVTLFVKFLTPQATFTSQQLPSQVTLFP